MTGIPTVTRRHALAGFAAAPFAGALAAPAAAANPDTTDEAGTAARIQTAIQGKETKVVLLGTGGGPVVGTSRLQSCTVLWSGGKAYVLDCGMDVSQRFAQAGFRFPTVDSVYLSLQRPDHLLGYGPFLVEGWIMGMRPETQIYGPPPLEQMTRDYLASMKPVTDNWSRDFHLPAFNGYAVQEIATARKVVARGDVTVSSILLDHPTVVPAIGYRFDFADRSIVFAPDTAPVPDLVAFARGADVLIHDAMYIPGVQRMIRDAIARGQPIRYNAYMQHMMADHTTVQRAAELAEKAGVKTLVLYHISPVDIPISDAAWQAAAGAFSGRTVIARDLMVI